ncbi:hypothetical protein RDI58_029442 [Solanum bulbocastanum]|uniref:DDE Tnp4 domain-containing protein n=1 Tax=Solanum bulbocastanum TaxID=147425 RepID=A0AAN8SXI5_SOLBU
MFSIFSRDSKSHLRRVVVALCQAPPYVYSRNMTGVYPKIRHNNRFCLWFKGCIGAIDGTYIQGEVPRNKQQAYRWEGNAHDSKVLDNAILDSSTNFSFPPHECKRISSSIQRNAISFARLQGK